MRSVTYRLADLNKVAIPIGFVGENEHTRVTFDCKKVFDEYPSALAALTVQPPYGAAYPAVVVRSGDTVYWDVYDSDLAHEGRGEAQLTFSENGVVVKSFIFRTIIERSIMGAGEAPEPLDDFLARAGEALTAIPQTIEDTFAQISAEAETLAPGSAATASFDDETMKLSFGIPKGEKGDQGEQGETGQTGPQGVSVTNAVVNDDYTLTLTFSDGDSYTSQSIRGPQGETGQTGQTGATPDFSIGTVTTGAAGSSAEASITGTAEAPVLNLTIPRGDKGSKGDKGNKGDTGATPAFSIGTVTTGAAGSDAAATITGTAAAPVLNLTIPRGASGDGGMIAQLYSSSKTYAVGDHVEYNGAFYVCKTAITTAEAWNSAHWTQTTAGDELTSQKADIEELESSKADAIEVTDSTPASVMSFSDGGDGYPLSATFEIAPVQDLHGQEYPWPAGGGKNLMPNITAVRTEGEAIWIGQTDNTTYPIHLEANQAYTISFTSNVTSAVYFKKNGGSNIRFGASGDTYTPSETMDVQMWVYATSGLTSVTNVQLEKGSSATPYAPYENDCPITGWTGCKPSRTGKNLIPNGTDTSKGYESGRYLKPNGDYNSSSNYNISEYFRVKGGANFVYSKSGTPAGMPSICFYDSSKTFISGTKFNDNASVAITTPSNAVFARASVPSGSDTVQFEAGSVATAHVAFAGAITLDISFPAGAGTVYGGTLTVNKDGTGGIVDNLVHITIDSDSTIYQHNTYSSQFAIKLPSHTIKGVTGNQAKACNQYATGTFTSAADRPNGKMDAYLGSFGGQSGQNEWVAWRDDRFTTISAMEAWIAENPIYLVAVRYSNATTSMTGIDTMTSLKGVNNLWADCGDVLSVDYSADTKLYVDGKISEGMKLIALLLTANHEDGMKASKAYASGDLLTVGNTLYKATTSIANGATLTAGTNVTETTIETELAALA